MTVQVAVLQNTAFKDVYNERRQSQTSFDFREASSIVNNTFKVELDNTAKLFSLQSQMVKDVWYSLRRAAKLCILNLYSKSLDSAFSVSKSIPGSPAF